MGPMSESVFPASTVPVQAPDPAPEPARPALARLLGVLQTAVAAGRMPGATVHVALPGAPWTAAVGERASQPAREPLDRAAVYDAASLTKVAVTAPVFARLFDEGEVRPDTLVHRIVPVVSHARQVTLAHLLAHTSGHAAGLPPDPPWEGREVAYTLAAGSVPTHPPEQIFRYSDINFILLGAVAERLTGLSLDALAARWLLEPLRMADSGYLPLRRHPAARLVPTEVLPGAGPLRGQVHDPTARRMGGVAGHAGLFTTVDDLARYGQMLLAGGLHEGRAVLGEGAIRRMTAVATPPAMAERRSLGWDLRTPYSRARGTVYGEASFGHTGFTGCAFWIDPALGGFHVLLSNRVHPTVREGIVDVYEAVATHAATAIAAVRTAGR